MRIINIGIIFIVFAIQACSQRVIIQVENQASFDRKTETIEIQWNEINTKLNLSNSSPVAVSEDGNKIVHQVIDIDANGTPDYLLFQSSFKQDEKKQFTIMKVEANVPVESITDAKYILPRKDVAWENDCIAFRIYGGPLAGDVQSGLDVWVKRVRYHIIDKWYDGDSLKGKKRISYHVDHGEGADMFNVGKTLGAGGSALWVDTTLCQFGLFTKEQIIATGPIRAMFTVTYDTVLADGETLNEEKTYTLDAGENLNRIDVHYTGLKKDGAVNIALGLVKREGTIPYSDESNNWLSLWGLVNDDSTNGYLGTGLILPKRSYRERREDANNYLIIGSTSADKQFTYYAGAGWTRSGDFSSVDNWNSYLKTFTLRLESPLRVMILDTN